MKTLTLNKKEVDYKSFVKRAAKEDDCTNTIDEEFLLYNTNGDLKIAYIKVPEDLTLFNKILKNIKYQKDKRSSGLVTISRIFGYMPRIAVREDYCHVTSLARENPRFHAYICNMSKIVEKYYKQYFPKKYEYHKRLTDENTLPEYRIGELFTSGIINKNNPLNYHFDKGNYPDVYSGMFINRNDCTGGNLSCPEYNLNIKLKDGYLIIFDGQGLLHGVTPIRLQNKNAYRYTTVFYSLKALWNCEPLDKEIARIKTVRFSREQKRAETVRKK